jgi:cysteine desulfurase/selenocysteine lyase
MLDLRQDFPAFGAGAGHFLDSAASTLKPRVVLEAMHEFAGTLYANVHRGAYRLSTQSTELYEQARATAASFIGAGSAEEVILCRGTTTGLNMVAAGWGGVRLRPGESILLTHMEHHANIVPWQMVASRTGARLEYVELTTDFSIDLDDFQRKLERRPAVVAFTGMSNVLGTIPPVRLLADAARSAGALVVLDAAQLVPHRAPRESACSGVDGNV